MSTMIDIVDAITSDLEGLSLPGHDVWKYIDPPIVLQQNAKPLLGVFPRGTAYTLISTESSYEVDDEIIISWFVPMSTSMETGGAADPEVASAGARAAALVEAQLRSYGVAVPDFFDANEATVISARYGVFAGSSTWAAEFTLKVTRWP